MRKITEAGQDWIAVVENRIIDSPWSYSPTAQKLLLLAISRIEEPATATELPELVINVADFQNHAGTSSHDTYQALAKACDELGKTPLKIRLSPNDRSRKDFFWFDTVTYDGQGEIKIKFAATMAQFLIGLKARFTQLRIQRFFKLRSSYSVAFLQKITQVDDNKRPGWTMSIDELREWLGTSTESYPSFGMLRVRVLETAQRELDAKSDRGFDFTPLKTGRQFRGVEFRIRPARHKTPPPIAKLLAKEAQEVSAAALTKALQYARTLPRWIEPGWNGVQTTEGQITDEQIIADPAFANVLKRFVDEAHGQSSLDTQDA